MGTVLAHWVKCIRCGKQTLADKRVETAYCLQCDRYLRRTVELEQPGIEGAI